MSRTVTETTITRKYLRGKTKDDIIEHVMRLLDEGDKLTECAERLRNLNNPDNPVWVEVIQTEDGPLVKIHAPRDSRVWIQTENK